LAERWIHGNHNYRGDDNNSDIDLNAGDDSDSE
jgi:hypothetical protein